MAWIYLFLAGIFEIGWPLGFKLSQTTEYKYLWIVFSVVTMACSGYFLYLAQKGIPIGTAYAVWTGIGSVGTLIIGVYFFKDIMDLAKLISVSLIIIGIVGLRISG